MKLRVGPGAAAGGDLVAIAAAAVITLLNGLAFGLLCFVMIFMIILLADPAALGPSAWVWGAWAMAAWLLACGNIVLGIKAMDQPSWRRLAWLYGSTGAAVLLYPGMHLLLF